MGSSEPIERVPDWLLGGRVRRRVFAALTGPDGQTAVTIAKKTAAGEASVYEILRALKPLGALEAAGGRGHWRLTEDGVGEAIRRLLKAADAYIDEPVDRPPGRVKQR